MGSARVKRDRNALREYLTLTLNPETKALLDALSDELDLPRGRIVDRAVRELAETIRPAKSKR